MVKRKLSCVDCLNQNCMIKQYCPTSLLDEVNENKHIDFFPEKHPIFWEGNRVECIYFIQSGIVKVFKQGAFNKNQIVRFSISGDILGHRGLNSSDIYPVSSQSQTTAKICCFQKDYFLELLNRVPELAVQMMFLYSNEMNNVEKKLRDMALFTVREKTAKAILMLKDSLGLNEENEINSIENFSRQDIAELVGLTSNQLTKVLSEFKASDILEIKGGSIKIVAPESLSDLVDY